ncbi:MAG TPA: invasion associated locus B family protein [Rhizomicrobium sp.]
MSGLSMHHIFAAALCGGLLLGSALPAAAEDPTLLGASKGWFAYSLGKGDAMVCYALARPSSEEPRKVKRDPAYFLINDWPGRKAKAEPEIVSGYLYKDGSAVTAQVGSDRFSFFTKNDGKSGSAWVLAQADEERLIAAMKDGAQALVSGTSKRGTTTHDIYPLAGLSDALDKIHQSCGM